MKKIVLFCAGGMSTGILVNKMRDAAKQIGYECDINAFGMADAEAEGKDADVVLVGPQIRYNIAKIKEQCPHCPVEAIDMTAYGMMDGKKVLEIARKAMGEI